MVQKIWKESNFTKAYNGNNERNTPEKKGTFVQGVVLLLLLLVVVVVVVAAAALVNAGWLLSNVESYVIDEMQALREALQKRKYWTV